MTGWRVLAVVLLLAAGNWFGEGLANARSGPIQSAELIRQPDSLYAHVRLDDGFLQALVRRLQEGETILAGYQLRLYRVQPWWPDAEVTELVVTHRVRWHLITEKLEMQEDDRAPVYSDDLEDAEAFIGRLRMMLLYIHTRGGEPPAALRSRTVPSLFTGGRYRLEVLFRLEDAGISRPFRVLNRLIKFWRPVDHQYTLEVILS